MVVGCLLNVERYWRCGWEWGEGRREGEDDGGVGSSGVVQSKKGVCEHLVYGVESMNRVACLKPAD